MVGQTLAHYKILKKIGSGGMGEVFLAEDTKLDRNVALKVLPPELAENEERRARFQREAKAIAALNHPSIVTVYSVEEAAGVHFITMELVKGKTLAELLPKNGFPVDRFLEIAIPLTDAIAAAHDEGTVHRDLKPGNVMVGDDGRVKVLDFGLAQLEPPVRSDGDSESPTELKTREGVIAGTLRYMSPEQAEGRRVDRRTDIFSLGVVLYEMATGRHPFEGDTPVSILSAIVKDTPKPVRDINPAIPRRIAEAIHRCLEKDPARRFSSASDLKRELESRSAGDRTWWKAAAAAVLLGLAGVLVFAVWPRSDGVPRLTRAVQVTSAQGVEDYPTWSPDGERLAFESNQSGNWDIWVVQLGGAVPVNLTARRPEDDRYPSWSPDGSTIAFTSRPGSVLVMSAVGGTPRTVLTADGARLVREPQWSSDGSELAATFWATAGGMFIEIVSLDSGESRRVDLPENCEDMSWSPDGRFFACVAAGMRIWEVARLWLHPISGGEAIPLTEDPTQNWSPSWSADARRLYYVSNRGGASDLWQQRLGADGRPEGEPEEITTGVGMRSAAFSPDGRKLAYSRGGRVSNVWRVPILEDRPATWNDAEQLTSDRAYIRYLDVSPDGQRLAVSSDRVGDVQHLWTLPTDGGEMIQLTSDTAPDLRPAWSPDGSQIAFMSWRSGTRDIFVMPASGGPARPLVVHPAVDHSPVWSPDGTEIAFFSNRTGNNDLWVVPAGGGEPRQVTTDPAIDQAPLWSLDGEWLIFESWRDGGTGLWRIPVEGGDAEPVTERHGRGATWSPDGKRLYIASGRNDGAERSSTRGNLWVRELDSGREYAVTALTGRPGFLNAATLDTDGTYLYFTWQEELGDIWVMDVAQE